jgi:hypothetical protein
MPPTITGYATPIPPEPVSGDAATRLRRLRGLTWLLDRSIPIGKYRIGLDPILGVLPAAGDWIGALLSFYVLYEGARLGMPNRVLARMGGNILVETVVGAIPFLGDLFDFVWKANAKNLALIEQHYHPRLEGRSMRTLGLILALFFLFVLALIGLLFFAIFQLIEAALRNGI